MRRCAKSDKIDRKREKEVSRFIKNILKLSMFAVMLPCVTFGVQQPNPRGVANSRADEHSSDETVMSSARRAAKSVVARSASQNDRQARAVVVARPVIARSAAGRSGVNVARSAGKSSFVRSGVKAKQANVNAKSRAGAARATAVFNDVSKISGGYADCRDAYATCMDQVCATANDTYRRCFCSDRFVAFRDVSDKIDEAVGMLADFQDTNLDAVNKTAAEVNAMYSATEGEDAIKRDTTASQKLLDSIANLLSGKKSTYKAKTNVSMTSLGVLNLSAFSNAVGDVFGDSSSSVFGGDTSLGRGPSTYTDISSLEGEELYDAAMQQCMQITRDSCSGDALFNLARSSYSILITQDCNAYEKNLNAKKATLEDTVRTAEKYLREARLAEYRAHNSSDVNDCLMAVDVAMRRPLACGENYELCLDPTGKYINVNTGEPIYSPALFELNSVIVLDGSSNVVGANPVYSNWFDEKKKFAAEALDSCRGIADDVWEEYKRVAIIQVAQAQDNKIEEIKSLCVQKIKDCYDTNTNALKDLAGEEAQTATNAISVITARDQCKNAVFSCAALYGDPNGCKYDDSTKRISAVEGKKCGLQSLLAMVDAVDSVKFAKNCETALREYVEETCAPVSGDADHAYPWGCVKYSPAYVEELLVARAAKVCAGDFGSDYNINNVLDKEGKVVETGKYGGKLALDVNTQGVINDIIKDMQNNMVPMLRSECLAVTTEGTLVFDATGHSVSADDVVNVSPSWMLRIYGNTSLQNLVKAGVSGYTLQLGGAKLKEGDSYSFGWGICMMPSEAQLCRIQGQLPGMASTVEFRDGQCVLKSDWFNQKCKMLGGYMSGNNCWFR